MQHGEFEFDVMCVPLFFVDLENIDPGRKAEPTSENGPVPYTFIFEANPENASRRAQSRCTFSSLTRSNPPPVS